MFRNDDRPILPQVTQCKELAALAALACKCRPRCVRALVFCSLLDRLLRLIVSSQVIVQTYFASLFDSESPLEATTSLLIAAVAASVIGFVTNRAAAHRDRAIHTMHRIRRHLFAEKKRSLH